MRRAGRGRGWYPEESGHWPAGRVSGVKYLTRGTWRIAWEARSASSGGPASLARRLLSQYSLSGKDPGRQSVSA
jgi:hypothetical protein